MLKRISTCIVILITSLMAGWVSFDGTPTPTPPSITILQNDAQAVVLNVKIHGMFSEDTTVEGITYQLIYIPQEITTSDIGKAEIPILKRLQIILEMRI